MFRTLLFLILVTSGGVAFATQVPNVPMIEMLVKNDSVKVVRLTLQPGGVLPTHTTPVDATVVALSGTGTVTIGEKTHALPAHGVIFLPKGVPHDVKNAGTTPLVAVVHHLLTTK